MSKPIWIMQTNLGDESDIGDYVRAVRRSGSEVVEISHVPFSETVPDIPCGPAILYGSVGFVTAAHRSGRWTPGAFGDQDMFCYSSWASNYGKLLLNSPDAVERTSAAKFLKTDREDASDIFARPAQDTKSFSGSTRTVGDMKDFCRQIVSGEIPDLTSQTEILVCEPYGIEAEWRLFIADREVVAASGYRKNGRMCRTKGAPSKILDFGIMAAAVWSPARMYTLDVCLSAGNPYIVEAQGYNSSGTYAADLDAIVRNASRIAQSIADSPSLHQSAAASRPPGRR